MTSSATGPPALPSPRVVCGPPLLVRCAVRCARQRTIDGGHARHRGHIKGPADDWSQVATMAVHSRGEAHTGVRGKDSAERSCSGFRSSRCLPCPPLACHWTAPLPCFRPIFPWPPTRRPMPASFSSSFFSLGPPSGSRARPNPPPGRGGAAACKCSIVLIALTHECLLFLASGLGPTFPSAAIAVARHAGPGLRP